jgi:hypothetical protein
MKEKSQDAALLGRSVLIAVNTPDAKRAACRTAWLVRRVRRIDTSLYLPFS